MLGSPQAGTYVDALHSQQVADQHPSLSPATISVLAVLLADPAQPWYGFELCRAAALKSGTVYPMLARLERMRWLASDWEQGDPSKLKRPRRRLYRLTGEGEVAGRAALTHLEAQLRRAKRPVVPPARARARPA
jgi:PadR family transcriptional regulator PadR